MPGRAERELGSGAAEEQDGFHSGAQWEQWIFLRLQVWGEDTGQGVSYGDSRRLFGSCMKRDGYGARPGPPAPPRQVLPPGAGPPRLPGPAGRAGPGHLPPPVRAAAPAVAQAGGHSQHPGPQLLRRVEPRHRPGGPAAPLEPGSGAQAPAFIRVLPIIPLHSVVLTLETCTHSILEEQIVH
jgi:hypothetical protein